MSFLSYIISEWTLLIAVLLFAFYKWSTAGYDFFKKKNVPFLKPLPLIGNFGGMLFKTESILDAVKRMYLSFSDQKLYGAFVFREPHLVIRDPDLIKQIAVKDFDHFSNHFCMIVEEDAPLLANSLFFLKDQKWKDMRSTLSPAFTGSKMRLMFQLVEETCRTAVENLKADSKKTPLVLELKELFTRYTSDIIATTAFGLKVDSLKDKDNEFYKMGERVTNFTSPWFIIKLFLSKSMSAVMKLFGIKILDQRNIDYFYNLVMDTMKYRKENNIYRPDMINLLMEARQGKLKATENEQDDVNGLTTFEEKSHVKSQNLEWTDVDIVAQCFLFLTAGFETASYLMCFCAHELMENPEIQQKLYAEINEVKKELNGKPLSYEILQKMKYMEMVISETLRKWPPQMVIDRVCNKPYTIIDDTTGNTIQIEQNDKLTIPVGGIHRDPKYYPKPDIFDPERFNTENKGNINPSTFLPFGIGPRLCIGSRLALMESKAIIFYLLTEFTFEVSEKSTVPLELALGFAMKPKNGFWVHLKPRI